MLLVPLPDFEDVSYNIIQKFRKFHNYAIFGFAVIETNSSFHKTQQI